MRTTRTSKPNIARALLLQLTLYLLQGLLLSVVSSVLQGASYTALIIKLLSTLTSCAVFLLPLLLYLRSNCLNFLEILHPFSRRRGNSPQSTRSYCYESTSASKIRVSLPVKFIQAACATSILLTVATLAGWITNRVAQALGESIAYSSLPSDTPLLILSFISSVIVSPIIEELLFRGAVINSAEQFGKPAAIALSAFTFAFMHYSAYKFFYALCAGAVIAFFAIKKCSVPFASFLHSANNLITFVFSLLLSFSKQLYNTVFIIFLSVTVPLALFGIAALIYEHRTAPKGLAHCHKHNTAEGFITLELIVYVAFSIALMPL